MKKIIVLISILSFFSISYWWTYPLKEVSKPVAKCKFAPWNTLSSSCKMPLPKLTPKDYKKYLKNLTYRRIYTVLWWATYKYGWDQWYGSHLWVDIATSLWTPVYSIWDWKVVFVWTKKWRWKTIVIQHKVNWKYIYSNYAHLSKITVKANQYVKEWQKIWEVGHSGFSIWNHLHFQIDTNQALSKHPYRYLQCARWKSIMSVVNSNICFNDLAKNTVDPLAFLASNWAIIKSNNTSKVKKIPRKNMLSYEEIRKQMIKEFLKTHKFKFSFPNAGVYYVWKYGYFNITLKDKKWRNFKDILPWDLNIIYDRKYFSSFYPRTLKILNWTRKVTFLPKKPWVVFITAKLWDFVIYQKPIRIVYPNQTITPYKWSIITAPKKLYIWYPAWWVNVFKDKGYFNIVKVPFNWRYTLESTTKDITFCKAPTNPKYLNFFQCNPKNMSNKLTFSYKDTIYWVLVFKFFSNSWKPTQLIIKDSKWKIISKSPKLFFNKVKFTNQNYIYNSYIQKACKLWLCLNLITKWYIWSDKPLSKYYEKKLLENLLNYLWKPKKFTYKSSEKYVYVTRKEFISNVLATLWIKIKKYNQKTKYLDVKDDFKNTVIYLSKLGFKRKDKFAKHYFQPNKKITLWEAFYFIIFMLEKLKN